MLNMSTYKLDLPQKNSKALSLFITVVCLTIACQASADESSVRSVSSIDAYDNWPRATDSELAQQRGGFMLPNGVTIDFSFERIISLNGVETFSSLLQFPENGLLLQNGSHNMASDLIVSGLGNVIQNNLDDQVIKTINEINIEIGNLQNIGLHNSHGHGSMNMILPVLH
jgi:hypothetical protein